MIAITGSPVSERLRATISKKNKMLLAQEREIAKLQHRIAVLQRANEYFSYRVAELESGSVRR